MEIYSTATIYLQGDQDKTGITCKSIQRYVTRVRGFKMLNGFKSMNCKIYGIIVAFYVQNCNHRQLPGCTNLQTFKLKAPFFVHWLLIIYQLPRVWLPLTSAPDVDLSNWYTKAHAEWWRQWMEVAIFENSIAILCFSNIMQPYFKLFLSISVNLTPVVELRNKKPQEVANIPKPPRLNVLWRMSSILLNLYLVIHWVIFRYSH